MKGHSLLIDLQRYGLSGRPTHWLEVMRGWGWSGCCLSVSSKYILMYHKFRQWLSVSHSWWIAKPCVSWIPTEVASRERCELSYIWSQLQMIMLQHLWLHECDKPLQVQAGPYPESTPWAVPVWFSFVHITALCSLQFKSRHWQHVEPTLPSHIIDPHPLMGDGMLSCSHKWLINCHNRCARHLLNEQTFCIFQSSSKVSIVLPLASAQCHCSSLHHLRFKSHFHSYLPILCLSIECVIANREHMCSQEGPLWAYLHTLSIAHG